MKLNELERHNYKSIFHGSRQSMKTILWPRAVGKAWKALLWSRAVNKAWKAILWPRAVGTAWKAILRPRGSRQSMKSYTLLRVNKTFDSFGYSAVRTLIFASVVPSRGREWLKVRRGIRLIQYSPITGVTGDSVLKTQIHYECFLVTTASGSWLRVENPNTQWIFPCDHSFRVTTPCWKPKHTMIFPCDYSFRVKIAKVLKFHRGRLEGSGQEQHSSLHKLWLNNNRKYESILNCWRTQTNRHLP